MNPKTLAPTGSQSDSGRNPWSDRTWPPPEPRSIADRITIDVGCAELTSIYQSAAIWPEPDRGSTDVKFRIWKSSYLIIWLFNRLNKFLYILLHSDKKIRIIYQILDSKKIIIPFNEIKKKRWFCCALYIRLDCKKR